MLNAGIACSTSLGSHWLIKLAYCRMFTLTTYDNGMNVDLYNAIYNESHFYSMNAWIVIGSTHSQP